MKLKEHKFEMLKKTIYDTQRAPTKMLTDNKT